MSIIFDILGHIIIEDKRDILYVNTTTSNVSGDKDVLFSIFDAGKSIVSLILT